MHATRVAQRRTPVTARELLLVTLLVGAAALILASPALGARDLNLTIVGPTTSMDNETVSYNVTASNSGTGAGAGVEAQLFLNGNATATLHDFGNLADGESGVGVELFTLACGVYNITGTVDPSDGVPETNETNNGAQLTLVVTPFANFSTNRTGDLGAYTYTFNASASHGCSALNYTWTIGGVTRHGLNVSSTPLAGNLTVSLAVRAGNNSLLTGRINRTIAVPNAAPSLTLTLADDTIPTGWPLGLVVTSDDTDGTIFSTFIDFGDGNNSTSAIDAAIYEYLQSGNFTVVVRVIDNVGANSTSSVAVHVTNRLPTVATSFPYWNGNVGTPINFDATGSSDPDAAPLTITWDFGDGTAGTGPVVSHTYASPGTYTAIVTVTDANGGSQSRSMQVKIDPAPTPGAFPWWLLILVIAAVVLVFYLVSRRRKDKPGEPKTFAPEMGEAPKADEPASEGSSSKPPSP